MSSWPGGGASADGVAVGPRAPLFRSVVGDYSTPTTHDKDILLSLWTPDGERPVSRDPQPSTAPPTETGAGLTPDVAAALEAAGIDVESLTPQQRQEAAAMMTEMAQVREQLLSTPAVDVVANHLMGIYELAAIHLGENPPNFGEATIAIEALRSVLERLEGQFGENEAVLRKALSQLQMTFVQLKEAVTKNESSPTAD